MNALNPSNHYQPLQNSHVILFHNNPFQIHIINTKQPYPHEIISCDSPIQYWKTFEIEGKNYVCVVDSIGNWIIYSITKQLVFECKGTIFNQTSRTVGIHHIPSLKSYQLIFVLECGKLQYNYLPPLSTPTNREYTLPNLKLHNLFNSFYGANLLETKSTSKILQSTYILSTKELLLIFHNTNDNIYSIINVIVEQYQVRTGQDMLLNLGQRPKDIITVSGTILVNLGSRIVCWVNGKVTTLQIQGYCRRVWQNSNNIMVSLANKQGHHLQKYTLQLNPTPFLRKISSFKFPAVSTPVLSILSSTLVLTQKLELLQLSGQQYIVMMSNLHSRITKGEYIDTGFTKYFKFNKQIGGVKQGKIYTNARFFTQINTYAHNMLIRMAELIAVTNINNQITIYLTSPIIGTLPILLDSTKPASLAISQAPPSNLPNLNQQSLCLQSSSTLNQSLIQITPTHILTSSNSTSISQLFEQKVEQILCACIVGSYILMLVQKQVHIYYNNQDQLQKGTKENKGKVEKGRKLQRLHLYCFQSEVQKIIALNNVNLWAAILWNGCVQILQIHQKQSTKIHQLAPTTSMNPTNVFSFAATINTAPHTLNILSNTLLICSNDPLHIYQPQKTTFKAFPLGKDKFGQQFYPVIDLSSSMNGIQKNRILGVIGGKWRFINFQTKYLVNAAEDIKLQIEEILGFPQIQNLIFCAIKDDQCYFFCGSFIVAGTIQTGQIVYQQCILEKDDENKSQVNNSHIRKWIKEQQISYESIDIEGGQQMSQKSAQIIRLSDKNVLLYGQKQIWYASILKKNVKLISYFSTPNDAFVEFRNNLSIHQLQNQQFIQMFADKLPIKAVAKINASFFAVLYPKMVIVVQIRSNGSLAIYQEIPFCSCPNLIEITEFIGNYDEMSLYMKDSGHRLVDLKYNEQSKNYTMEIKEELEDQVVCIQRVKGWQQKVLKVGLTGEIKEELDKIVLRSDGQLLVGTKNPKPIYL